MLEELLLSLVWAWQFFIDVNFMCNCIINTDNTKRRAGRAGGPCLPNEKDELSAGWQAAQKSGPAGCTTTGLAGGLG